MSTAPLPECTSGQLDKDLGRIFHYLIHEKNIIQYFHELRYAKNNKHALRDLIARAVLEARRDKSLGSFTGRIPSTEELLEGLLSRRDEELLRLVEAILLTAVAYDFNCEKCRGE